MHTDNILIVDDDDSLIKTCTNILGKHNLQVTRCENNLSTIIGEIIKSHPKFVILSVFMPDFDAIEIIKCINSSRIMPKPLFIAMSSIESDTVQRDLKNTGAFYVFYKPVDPFMLCERILEFSKIYSYDFAQEQQTYPNIEVAVTEIIHKIGIPASIKGYYYLREAIMMSVENSEYLHAVTKSLYPSVARHFNTTAPRVERAIRHSIDVAWLRGNAEGFRTYFGYTPDTHSKPTNSEFIAIITDMLRLKLRYQK